MKNIQNVFVRIENGDIKESKLSYEDSIPGWEKVIPQFDIDTKLTDEEKPEAQILLNDFNDFEKRVNKYSLENTMSWLEKRLQSKDKGGYGTSEEQMEMIYDAMRKDGKTLTEAFELWLQHCDAVKQRFPKG